jgi:hypothetical protein
LGENITNAVIIKLQKKEAFQPPIISFKPSITLKSSSRETLVILFPILFIERVLTWLILTHDFLGSFESESSRVSGKPAR